MRKRGFTFVELITVMAIMTVLMSLATLAWNQMQLKASIETQARTMYADLMMLRQQALYTKTPRTVVISNQQFRIYSSAVITATPFETKKLMYPVVWNSSNTTSSVEFDTQGLMNGNECSICILPTNDTLVVNSAVVDSLVISQARINLGRRTGGDCKSANIEQK